jgi:hypothetical protein
MAVAFIIVLAPLSMRIAAMANQSTPGIAGKFLCRTSRDDCGHPDKEENIMGHHKHRSGEEKPRQTTSTTPRGSENQEGGREFGQVIDPMQAQMASGNEGLAEDPGEAAKKKAKSGKKAA